MQRSVTHCAHDVHLLRIYCVPTHSCIYTVAVLSISPNKEIPVSRIDYHFNAAVAVLLLVYVFFTMVKYKVNWGIRG